MMFMCPDGCLKTPKHNCWRFFHYHSCGNPVCGFSNSVFSFLALGCSYVLAIEMCKLQIWAENLHLHVNGN